jgi:hypothetical protein
MGEAKEKKLAKDQRAKLFLALLKLDRMLIVLINTVAYVTLPLWGWAVIYWFMYKDIRDGKASHLYDKFFWEQ